MELVRTEELTKYFGGLAAVVDFNLMVEKGEIVGIIGPNGAGKTTLFNLLSGVLSPTEGKVYIKGEEVTGLKPHSIARKGLVRTFQLASLFREMTALENVLSGLYLSYRLSFWDALLHTLKDRRRENEMKEMAMDLLRFVDMDKLWNEPAKNLPFGYQRHLGIAVALAASPQVLALDEPLGGMNPQEVDVTLNHIRNIVEKGISVLLVEHNVRAVMNICQKVWVMNLGHEIARGIPEEIMQNRKVIEAYLGEEHHAA